MRQLLQDTAGHHPARTGGKFVFVVTTGDVKTNLCPSITRLILEGSALSVFVGQLCRDAGAGLGSLKSNPCPPFTKMNPVKLSQVNKTN